MIQSVDPRQLRRSHQRGCAAGATGRRGSEQSRVQIQQKGGRAAMAAGWACGVQGAMWVKFPGCSWLSCRRGHAKAAMRSTRLCRICQRGRVAAAFTPTSHMSLRHCVTACSQPARRGADKQRQALRRGAPAQSHGAEAWPAVNHG
ncbi:hypothetical protein P154DRAFT_176967 [Amniculicola lignicola CBS 123094]|uniref:Uncharacterized protein n=1 Tax=Amniculicola lignicola CBS 123094 TaxID=1392246 RepID=A0A6A5X1H0_9PLEO|nr:hypothetical protein P154DRAFT_176967 [Amniculicola lignicola CBS 123094]